MSEATHRLGRWLVAALAVVAVAAVPSSAAARVDATGARTSATRRTAGVLPSWTRDSAERRQLIAYVKRVTKKGSSSFIPVKDRIAVFDQDGTIHVESPNEELIGEVAVAVHRAEEVVRENGLGPGNSLYDNLLTLKQQFVADPRFRNTSADVLYAVMAEAFAGWSADGYVNYVARFFKQRHPEKGITWAQGFYRPMVELIRYLEANRFTVYIVSASQREYLWGSAGKALGLERWQMIGTDVELGLSDPGTVVRGNRFAAFNYDEDKVFNIYRQVGKKPVLAFGNSSGDYPMMRYTMTNRYPSQAYLVVHDDGRREYEYDVESRTNAARANGWGVISMKSDWATIWSNTTSSRRVNRSRKNTTGRRHAKQRANRRAKVKAKSVF